MVHLLTTIFLSVLMIASTIIALWVPVEFNPNILFVIGVAGVAAYLAALWNVSKIGGFSWFGFLNLFCISFVIVHFQNPIFVAFIKAIGENNKLWVFREYACKAAAVSLSGFLSFLLIYVIVRNKRRLTFRERPLPFITPIKLVAVNNVLCFCTLISLLLFLRFAGRNYLGGAYSGVERYWGTGATYFFLLFRMFFFITITSDLYRLRIRHAKLSPVNFILKSNKWVLSMVSFVLLINMYVGDRGPILQTVALYLGAYSIFFSKVRFRTFIIAGLVGALLLAFIGKYRTSDPTLTMEEKIEKGKEDTSELQWYDVTGELAGSFRCMSTSVKVVEERGLFWGAFKAQTFASLFPFMGRYATYFVGNYGLSSQYLTSVLIGPNSHIGVGTTLIADIYLDFGLVGTILLMATIGWVIASVERRAVYSYDYISFAIYLLFLSVAIYWPRSIFIPHGKVIVWGALSLKVFHMAFAGNLRMRWADIMKLDRMKATSPARRLRTGQT